MPSFIVGGRSFGSAVVTWAGPWIPDTAFAGYGTITRPRSFKNESINRLVIKVWRPISLHVVSMLLSPIILCTALAFAQAKVTVYGQIALGFKTSSNAPAATSPAAYNDTRLTPPSIPKPAPTNAFALTLQQDAAVVGGLSIPHVGGCFWGFSIEMSVISQVRKSNSLSLTYVYLFFLITSLFQLEKTRVFNLIYYNHPKPLIQSYNSSFLAVPFLNLMSNLQDRCGGVVIRLGGNTQEFAALEPVGSLPKGDTFSKADSGANTTVS